MGYSLEWIFPGAWDLAAEEFHGIPVPAQHWPHGSQPTHTINTGAQKALNNAFPLSRWNLCSISPAQPSQAGLNPGRNSQLGVFASIQHRNNTNTSQIKHKGSFVTDHSFLTPGRCRELFAAGLGRSVLISTKGNSSSCIPWTGVMGSAPHRAFVPAQNKTQQVL